MIFTFIPAVSAVLQGSLSADYLNAGLLSSFSLQFLLAQDLAASDYLQLTLPFPMHAALTAAYANDNNGLSAPYALSCRFWDLSSPNTIKRCLLYTSSISSSIYFVKFLSNSVSPGSISSSSFWKLTLTSLDSSILTLQSSSQIFQVQVSAVADASSNALTYSANKVFGYFLLDQIPSALKGSFKVANINSAYTSPLASYQVFLDLDLSQLQSYVTESDLRIHAVFSSQEIGISGCSSVANSLSKISAISSTYFSCQIITDFQLNKLQIILKKGFNQTAFRVAFTVSNPKFPISQVKLSVSLMMLDSRKVLGFIKLADVITVNSISTTSHKITIGGFQPNSLLPVPVYLVRADSTGNENPMNLVKTTFSLSSATADSQQLKIVFSFNLQTQAYIPDRTIQSNLPSASNKIVTCSEESAGVPLSRAVVCYGVGKLLANTQYYLEFRLSLPYDVFKTNYSTSSFGSINIYLAELLGPEDRSFYVGRSDSLYEYLASQPQVYMIGRDSTFFNYFQTFFSVNIIASSKDFPYYASQSGIYPNNRPTSTPGQSQGFTDFFVVNQNLDFVNHLKQYSDIFFAAVYLESSDLVKGYKSSPLLSSVPKNVLSLSTINSNRWSSSEATPVLSSVSAVVTPTEKGIQPGNNILLFKISGSLTSISFSERIIYNWGLYILAPNTVTCPSPSLVYLVNPATPASTVSCFTQNSGVNTYTVIKIKCVNRTGPYSDLNGVFGVSGVSFTGSQWDFYMTAVDYIDGPSYSQVVNGYYLAHSGLKASASAGLSFSFINYYNTASTSLDGSTVPTMLRLKGTSTQAGATQAEIVLSQTVSFFPLNSNTRQVSCSSICYSKTVSNAYLPSDYSFPNSVLISLSASMDVVIPIVLPANKASINIYLLYKDSSGKVLKVNSFLSQPAGYTLRTSVSTSGLNFGVVVTTANTDTAFRVNAMNSNLVTVNSGANIGSGFSFFSKFDLLNGGTAALSNWNGNCIYLKYSIYTSSSSTPYYGVFCSLDSGTVNAAFLTVASAKLPTLLGLNIPASGGYSDSGSLFSAISQTYLIPAATTISTVTTPIFGSNLNKGTLVWSLLLPLKLQGNFLVQISSGNLPFSLDATVGACAVYSSVSLLKRAICTPSFVSTRLTFSVVLNQPLLAAGANLTLVLFGVSTSTVTSFGHNLKIYSLINNPVTPVSSDLICQALGLIVNANPTQFLGSSVMNSTSLVLSTSNMQASSTLSFKIQLVNHPIWSTQLLTIDLGQFKTDNSARTEHIACNLAKDDGSPLYWVSKFDFSSLSAVTITPRQHFLSSNITIKLTCYNLIVPSSNTPTPVLIALKVGSTSTMSSISLSLPTILSSVLTSTQSLTQSKQYSTPGCRSSMSFTFLSPLTATSRIYITFSKVYNKGLGTLFCYDTNGLQLFCRVQDEYTLFVKYLIGNKLRVEGIVQPIDYSNSQFRWKIDNDDDPSQVLQAGSTTESSSASLASIQNFPQTFIYALTISSNFQGTKSQLGIKFNIPSSVTIPSSGYLRLQMRTQFNQTLRASQLQASLNSVSNSIIQYVSSCQVQAVGVKCLVLQPIVPGQYSLTVRVSQPFFFFPFSTQPWIQFVGSTQSVLLTRSFSSTNNYLFSYAPRSPSLVYLEWYQDSKLNNLVVSSLAVLSKQIYLGNSKYARGFVVTGLGSTFPSVPIYQIGNDPIPVQIQLSQGYSILSAEISGDGGFHAGLPPLYLLADDNLRLQLQLSQTTITLPRNAAFLSITVASSLSIQPTSLSLSLPSTAGISLNVTSVTVSALSPSANIGLIISNPTTWAAFSSTVVLTVASSLYTNSAQVTISPGPNITAVSGTVTIALNGAKKGSLTASCDSDSIFYYYYSKDYRTVSDCLQTPNQIIDLAMGRSVLNTFFSCGAAVGSLTLVASVPKAVQLSLQAQSNYNLTGFCQSASGVQSSILSNYFSTQSNGGALVKLGLTFNSSLSAYQKIQLCCFLALKFQADYRSVKTSDGYYCSQLIFKRSLLQSRNLQSTSVSYVTVYFGVNNNLANDNVATSLNSTAVNNGIKTLINSDLPGLPPVISNSLAAGTVIGSPQLLTSFVDVGPNYIYGYNFKFKAGSGLLYVMIGANWTTNPSKSQVRVGQGANGVRPLYSIALLYDGTNKSLWFQYQPIDKYTNYQVYVLYTDENPFADANFGSLMTWNVTSEVAKWSALLLGLLTLSLVTL